MSEASLATLGVPGLATIVVVLSGVIVFLYRELKAERTRNDTLQAERLEDARVTRDKLAVPLEQIGRVGEEQSKMLDKVYESVLSYQRKV